MSGKHVPAPWEANGGKLAEGFREIVFEVETSGRAHVTVWARNEAEARTKLKDGNVLDERITHTEWDHIDSATVVEP